MVNDVSGGTADPDMLRVVADAGAVFVVMHMRGTPRTMQRRSALRRRRARSRRRAARAGRRRDRRRRATPTRSSPIPGIGFAKTAEHNLALLAALPELAARVEVPLLVGASRKSFLGRVLGDAPVDARDEATLATTVWCFVHGAAVVRVHDVAASSRARASCSTRSNARRPNGMAA